MRLTLTISGAPEAHLFLSTAAARLAQPPRPLLAALAATLQSFFITHIQTQTGPTGPWPPLSPITQKIRAYYGYPPAAPALIRAGDLLQSLTTLTLEDTAVEVGTRTSFARTLQDGGTVTDVRTGRPRTVQSFPFLFVTETELSDLLALITAYYFGATDA